MQQITSREQAVQLAERILAPRTRPILVVSSDPHPGPYEIDCAQLASEVGDVADLFSIVTGELTYALEAHMPPRTHVFGGAGRSYPADFAADPDPARSALRFPGKRATGNLIGDVLAQANAAGLFTQASVRNVHASGEVRGFLVNETRALVDLAGHRNAVVQRELTYPPTPLSWVLHKNQQISGVLDLDSNRLLVELPTPSIAELRDRFPHGCVTLALVSKVSATRGELLLHPKSSFTIRRGELSSNPLDTVDLLLAAGDVVRVRLRHHSEGGIYLSMLDVDDDEEVAPPIALTAGGNPWLVEGRNLPEELGDASEQLTAIEAPASPPRQPSAHSDSMVDPGRHDAAVAEAAPHAPAAPPRQLPGPGVRKIVLDRQADQGPETPAAAPPEAETQGPASAQAPAAGALRDTQLQLAAARAEITALKQRLAEVGADDSALTRAQALAAASESRLREELIERATLERKVAQLIATHRQGTQALRQARRAAPATRTVSRAEAREKWLSDEQWVRHEVYLAWVDRVPASDRESWPLREYRVGADFAGSLAALDEGKFAKAMRTAVDAVTGRIRELPQREVHGLRTGAGGDDPELVRADGARCKRAYIEQKTPSARRLHYWLLPNAQVELGRVALHDDMRP